MSLRRIGLYGVGEESLRLLRMLRNSAGADVAWLYDDDPQAALEHASSLGPELAKIVRERMVIDFDQFASQAELSAVVDDGRLQPFSARHPDNRDRGLQIVSPLVARLLFAYEVEPHHRKAELLQALGEVVESLELTIDSEELFTRMLEIAVGVTGAEGGSLMLLSGDGQVLTIAVAIGVEPELWEKIRVPIGEGIAGKVAENARPLHLRGKADRRHFHILRERLDVEAALSVPLVRAGRVLGVLNLHHSTRADAFDEGDLAFMQRVAALDAEIIGRAREHEELRDQAARFEAVRMVSELLGERAPLPDRLRQICLNVAGRMGNGIAQLYLSDDLSDALGDHGEPTTDGAEFRLLATSLEGGGFGGEYAIRPGQGVDGAAAETGRPRFLRGEKGALSYAALPLLVHGKVVGILTAQAGTSALHGRANEEALLEIAAALAEGVARSEHERKLRAQSTRVAAINETGIRMLSATDLGEIGRLATSSLSMILEADHALLRTRDPDTGRYHISAYYGSAEGERQSRLFELDKRASVEAIRRRAPLLIRELTADNAVAEFGDDFRSLIIAPLRREGQIIGTLSIYDKVTIDRFFASHFGEDDMAIFGKFASYVERAISGAEARLMAEDLNNFDADSRLPNGAYLCARVQEEIARSAGRAGGLALMSCVIENWKTLSEGRSPAVAYRAMLATADALRAELRDFDVLARTEPRQFTVLMPEPAPGLEEHIAALARAVSERVLADPRHRQPLRIELAFGYAIHPADGQDYERLLKRASEARIRMV